MAVNFAKRDVAPCFGARQHAVELFETIEFALQGLRRQSSTDNCALWSTALTYFRALLSPAIHRLLSSCSLVAELRLSDLNLVSISPSASLYIEAFNIPTLRAANGKSPR